MIRLTYINVFTFFFHDGSQFLILKLSYLHTGNGFLGHVRRPLWGRYSSRVLEISLLMILSYQLVLLLFVWAKIWQNLATEFERL